ncbi:MAG: Hsp20/alpha crystallin family protein [Cyclobacteriaceae bacterium]|nr:Hsp20/alpha crystallin family protein [Cyclobacteriaceae bacterium HetDA_MAG_MS6]
MALIKYNPLNYRPTSFSSLVDRVFNDDFLGDTVARSFSPKVDIAETDKAFEIQFHIPGVKKDEINIDLNEGRLTVSGERKIENEKKEKNFHSVESYYGTFSRSFHLPDSIDGDKVNATYEDGILSVVVPKDEKKVAKRTIAIK